MMATETELILSSPQQLKKYLEKLPKEFELRFPSITSLKGDFGVIIVIYNKKTKSVLLGAYNTTLSGLPKDKVKVESDDTSISTEETPFNLLRFGIVKETGLVCNSVKWLGFPKKVKNTNPDVDDEYHWRNYGLVDDFKGKVRMPDPILNPKIKEFVWVKESLLNILFEQQKFISGSPVRPHSQKEGYERFVKNKEPRSKMLTLTDVLRRKFSPN
ncbi:MAG: hypothetical protein JWL92_169 [Candidatus Nomurabacteria bacterium]|nr:hypothetical protein [Candidatus Nomurabacteria bacterium]